MGEAVLAPPYQSKSNGKVDEDFAAEPASSSEVNPQWGTGDDLLKACCRLTRGQKFHVNSLIINGDKSNPRD